MTFCRVNWPTNFSLQFPVETIEVKYLDFRTFDNKVRLSVFLRSSDLLWSWVKLEYGLVVTRLQHLDKGGGGRKRKRPSNREAPMMSGRRTKRGKTVQAIIKAPKLWQMTLAWNNINIEASSTEMIHNGILYGYRDPWLSVLAWYPNTKRVRIRGLRCNSI